MLISLIHNVGALEIRFTESIIILLYKEWWHRLQRHLIFFGLLA